MKTTTTQKHGKWIDNPKSKDVITFPEDEKATNQPNETMTNKQSLIHQMTRRMNSNKQLAERTRLHRLDISEVNAEFQATMKTKLRPSARLTVHTLSHTLVELDRSLSRSLVELEKLPLHSELFEGAAFHLENAIRAFIEAETGVDIGQADLDLSKHEFHADSYQAAIDSVIAED